MFVPNMESIEPEVTAVTRIFDQNGSMFTITNQAVVGEVDDGSRVDTQSLMTVDGGGEDLD
ncbi:hypothetical protein A2U01_0061884 [Trifolium medium]|uniref:Uncharacterized protein n=1 Tax=Trifolium medium TaxID=97028 RepID=A0A392RVI1_9FABA|nr:hypothetical protein [Trifolium medium]